MDEQTKEEQSSLDGEAVLHSSSWLQSIEEAFWRLGLSVERGVADAGEKEAVLICMRKMLMMNNLRRIDAGLDVFCVLTE